MQEKPRAWVFGATGLTGQGIVRALCKAGVETKAHFRPSSASLERIGPSFRALGAEVMSVDWSSHALRESLREAPPSVVFLALGTTKARAVKDGQGYRDVDFSLTKMVVDCVVAEHPACRLVYISSVRAFGRDWSDYFTIRTELESLLFAAQNPVLVARPSLIIGDRIDTRTWETRAARLSDACLRGLRAFGLGRMAKRYESLSGAELGSGVVQLWLESYADEIAEVDDIRSASHRHVRRFSTEST